jgi:hypothetical protein
MIKSLWDFQNAAVCRHAATNYFPPNEIFPKLNKRNLFTAAVFGLKKL